MSRTKQFWLCAVCSPFTSDIVQLHAMLYTCADGYVMAVNALLHVADKDLEMDALRMAKSGERPVKATRLIARVSGGSSSFNSGSDEVCICAAGWNGLPLFVLYHADLKRAYVKRGFQRILQYALSIIRCAP
jgi:hypothetical protein